MEFTCYDTEDLHRCWVEDCQFDSLLNGHFICPRHFSIHRCEPGFCKKDFDNRCIFVGALRSNEEFISHILPHLYECESHIPFSRLSHIDFRGQCLNKHFEESMIDVIQNLCNKQLRNSHNKKEEHAQVKLLKTSSMMEQLLLERDLREISSILLQNTKSKKETRLLLNHGQSLTFYLLQKMTSGLYNEGKPLVSLSYGKWLNPLPKRAKFSKHFGIPMKKFAACLKSAQYLLKLTSVKQAISNKF